MKFLHRPVHDFEGITRNFEQIEQQDIYTGIGAPTFEANTGAFYFRKDTPAVALQMIYQNTSTVPSGATWTAIL